MYSVNLLILLMLIRHLVLILTQGKLKLIFLILLVVLSLISLIIFYFSIASTSALTYLMEVAQDWFEVGLN